MSVAQSSSFIAPVQVAQKTEQRATTQGKPVPLELRSAILEDAKEQILAGKTLEEIATKHGIAERTLEYWLAALGDEYVELRQQWVDGMLHEAGQLLKNSVSDKEQNGPDAALRLARARELWKRATWYAERRDRARYGDQAQLSVSAEQLGDLLMAISSRMLTEKQVNSIPALDHAA